LLPLHWEERDARRSVIGWLITVSSKCGLPPRVMQGLVGDERLRPVNAVHETKDDGTDGSRASMSAFAVHINAVPIMDTSDDPDGNPNEERVGCD